MLWSYLAGGDFDGGGKSKKSEKEKAPRRKSSIYTGARKKCYNYLLFCLHTRLCNVNSESGLFFNFIFVIHSIQKFK